MSDRRRRFAGSLLGDSLAAGFALLRNTPLFLRALPGTPLRVLGIVAFDTLHRSRTGRRLPPVTVSRLALFLNFQGCANAEWDGKPLSPSGYATLRAQLTDDGLGPCIDAYLQQLRMLESTRPAVDGNEDRFDEVRRYREAVARLSVQTAGAIALASRVSGHVVAAADCDGDRDVDLLARVLVQCQVIDDVLDYNADLAAALPSFLTACGSVSHALELTGRAVEEYGVVDVREHEAPLVPFRVALRVCTWLTRLIVRTARWRHRRDPALTWGNA